MFGCRRSLGPAAIVTVACAALGAWVSSALARPGPAILYQAPAPAPQLENVGVWTAPPILISGTSAYRDGEFLYQDFVYDDSGAYPADPRYAGNAADFVEIRLKPLSTSTAFRITYNSMLDPALVGTTIALGNSKEPVAVPHGARASMPAKAFVTVHGTTAEVRDADTNKPLGVATAKVNLERRQVDVRVPYSAYDPRGRRGVRIAAATGVWDPETDAYAKTGTGAAFYNVAFRYNQVLEHFVTGAQDAALAKGDLSGFFATVDFTKLASGVTDDSGVPRSGDMDMIQPSHFESAQGRGNSTGGDIEGTYRCESPCTYQYAGQLQPYRMHVPSGPSPAGGWGLVVDLHGSGGDYNGPGIGTTNVPAGTAAHKLARESLANAWGGSIVVTPEGRGISYFYWGQSGADVWEDIADVMRRYPINPAHHMTSGVSMGGCGSYKLAAQFPDFFTGIYPDVGCTASALPFPPAPPVLGGVGSESATMLDSLRWVPVMALSGTGDPLVPVTNTYYTALTLQHLGYRFDDWHFCDAGSCTHVDYRGWYGGWIAPRFLAWTRSLPPLRVDPPRVTYTANSVMNEPRYGLNSDHAYWISNIAVRDAADPPPAGTLGSVDVISRGFGVGDAAVNPLEHEEGTGPGNSTGAWNRIAQTWGAAPKVPKANELDITATNIGSITIDPGRARVGCDAKVNIDSDGPVEVTLSGCDRTVAGG